MTDEPEIHNIFHDLESNPDIEEGYPDLIDVISFEGFDYDSRTFAQQEVSILEPRLKELGYTNIVFFPGEVDSFGPLTRLCRTTNPEGNEVIFIYG